MIFGKKETPITKELVVPTKVINLTERQFHDYIIEYETGKIDNSEILIFFCYIVQHEKWERCRYDWLIELMDYGVVTEEGYVNPQKLKEYDETKVKTSIKF